MMRGKERKQLFKAGSNCVAENEGHIELLGNERIPT
jgi:hypothetical protein